MKPISLLLAGQQKSGKTHSLLSSFRSKRVAPERVLYVDNHGSTRAFPYIHRYTQAEPWGIWDLPYTDVDQLDSKIESIIQKVRGGNPPYDIIVVDDMSELEMTTFDKEDSRFVGKDRRQLWGQHLERMIQRLRQLTVKCGASFLATTRVAAADDYTKPGVRDVETKQLIRPQVIRPLIRGKVGEYIPYTFDMLVWQEIAQGKEHPVGSWNFRPEGAIWSGNRWGYFPQWPHKLKEPTFDALCDLIEAAEIWQAGEVK